MRHCWVSISRVTLRGHCKKRTSREACMISSLVIHVHSGSANEVSPCDIYRHFRDALAAMCLCGGASPFQDQGWLHFWVFSFRDICLFSSGVSRRKPSWVPKKKH